MQNIRMSMNLGIKKLARANKENEDEDEEDAKKAEELKNYFSNPEFQSKVAIEFRK